MCKSAVRFAPLQESHVSSYSSATGVHVPSYPGRSIWSLRAGNAERTGVAVDVERKVALLLEHGVRADRLAAERLVADDKLRLFAASDFQQRIELLRLYGFPLEAVDRTVFCRRLKSTLLPLLAFLDKHGYAFRHFQGWVHHTLFYNCTVWWSTVQLCPTTQEGQHRRSAVRHIHLMHACCAACIWAQAPERFTSNQYLTPPCSDPSCLCR